MPRFESVHASVLKYAMLKRMPECLFLMEDYDAISQSTGLNKEQIAHWGENVRARYPDLKQREEFLNSNSSTINSSKLESCYVTCFNVTPVFAESFVFPKSYNKGEFGISYFYSAFDKENEFGEFYIKFEEKVWEHKLVEAFERQGAGQVIVVPLFKDDANEAAANALNRVRALAERTGVVVVRGDPPAVIWEKAEAKRRIEDAMKQQTASEFDEKTRAAMAESLKAIGGQLASVNDDVCGVKEAVDRVDVSIAGVKEELLEINAVLRGRLEAAQAEIKRINRLRDQLESRVGRQTSLANKLYEATVRVTELEEKIIEKDELIRLYRALDTASVFLQAERDSKRPRHADAPAAEGEQ